jgi:hypothetical protein
VRVLRGGPELGKADKRLKSRLRMSPLPRGWTCRGTAVAQYPLGIELSL